MKKSIWIMLLATSLLSCKKWIDEAYQNPNKPVVVPPETVFPGVHANMARGVQFDARYVGKYVQNFVGYTANDTWDRHGYLAGSDANGEMWRIHYWNLGQNLINVINQTRETMPEYAGASYAMFCWSWLHLADIHGNAVILKQAFQADRLTFDYDEQQDVYAYVLQIADSAALYLTRAKADPEASARLAKGDTYMYGGNIDGYLKLAYGAKALAFHRWYNKADYKPDSVLRYVYLSFSSAAEDCSVKFTQTPIVNDQRNFFGPSRNNLGAFRASEWFINMLKGVYWGNVVDPRLAYIFKPAANGQYNGIKSGVGNTFSGTAIIPNFWGPATTTAPAGGNDSDARTYFKNSVPFPIMTYAQLQFVKAEAAHKKGDNATALQAYVAGINGHFDHLLQFTGYTPITPAARAAFLADPNIVPASASDLTRSKIMMQKYIALWGYGFFETWVDLCKVKYSTSIYQGWTFAPSFFPDNGGKPAYRSRPRFNSEYLWNIESLKKVNGFDPDYHTRETWYVNP